MIYMNEFLQQLSMYRHMHGIRITIYGHFLFSSYVSCATSVWHVLLVDAEWRRCSAQNSSKRLKTEQIAQAARSNNFSGQ